MLNISLSEGVKAIKKFLSIIREKDINELKEIYDTGGFILLQKHCENKANDWKTKKLNIGIIGNSGTGKSSCINALRFLTAKDAGAAKVGVNETTTEPKAFPHPNNELLVFWDLPGVGTPKFPKDEYLKRIGFENFDFFLIIASSRFTDNDIWLAKEINKNKKRFFFIRSKIDEDVKNDKRDNLRIHDEKSLLKTIKANIKENLEDLYDDDDVFLIDNYQPMAYDFQYLQRRIIEEFPTLKQEALLLSLNTWNECTIREKADALKTQIWLKCIASGAMAAVPIPGTSFFADLFIIVEQTNYFYHQLGLDDDSLSRLAEFCSTTQNVNVIHDIVKDKRLSAFLTTQGVIGFIRGIPLVMAEMAVEEGMRFLPIVGTFVASAASFFTTCYILNLILDDMVNTVLDIIKVANKVKADKFGYTDLIYVIHGIGQELDENVSQTVEKICGTIEKVLGDSNTRPLILPIQWRTNLTQDVNEFMQRFSSNQSPVIRDKKKQLFDILHYLTAHQSTIEENLAKELNKAHNNFMESNPNFNGKVSLIAHSLGSVITYDVLKTSALKFPVENFFAIGSPLGLWLQLRKTDVKQILESNDNFTFIFNINYSDDIVAHFIEPHFEKVIQQWNKTFECPRPTKICDGDSKSVLNFNTWKLDYELPSTENILHKMPLYPEYVGYANHSAYWESKELMKFIIQVLSKKKSKKTTIHNALNCLYEKLIVENNESFLLQMENAENKLKICVQGAESNFKEASKLATEAKLLFFTNSNIQNDALDLSTLDIDQIKLQNSPGEIILDLEKELLGIQQKNLQRNQIEVNAQKTVDLFKTKITDAQDYKAKITICQQLLDKLKEDYEKFKAEVDKFCAEWQLNFKLQP